jgi:hypothetical protein
MNERNFRLRRCASVKEEHQQEREFYFEIQV